MFFFFQLLLSSNNCAILLKPVAMTSGEFGEPRLIHSPGFIQLCVDKSEGPSEWVCFMVAVIPFLGNLKWFITSMNSCLPSDSFFALLFSSLLGLLFLFFSDAISMYHSEVSLKAC